MGNLCCVLSPLQAEDIAIGHNWQLNTLPDGLDGLKVDRLGLGGLLLDGATVHTQERDSCSLYLSAQVHCLPTYFFLNLSSINSKASTHFMSEWTRILTLTLKLVSDILALV